MQRILVLLTSAVLLIAAGCGSDSSLPEASGKGNVRAINAISTSPEINFLIEERLLSSIVHQGASSPVPYDDLNYTFNFEVFYAGESSLRRIASRNLDIVADRNYTFLVSGALASPTITVWEFDARTFADTDTVFALQLAHVSATLGALDFYFADAAVVPALGNQVATLSSGEIADPLDFPEGDYVLTITAAGDPTDVVYTSETTTFGPRDSYLLTTFDGDASDTAPVFVNSFSDLGNTVPLPDPNYPPTVQFINASMDLGEVDIYDDEPLTSLVISAHDFGDAEAPVDIPIGANTFYYTPAGGTTAVLLETPLTAFGGLRYRSIAVGLTDSILALPFAPDLRSLETGARVSPFNASNNFNLVDIYAVEPGTSLDDALPIRSLLATGIASTSGVLPAGSFDLYVTASTEKLALAGPFSIDVVAGDVVDLVVLDSTDPTVVDVLFLSGGPAP